MTRSHVPELLSPYLDEQVAPRERERIEAHLRECARCRAHLESLRETVALLRGLDPVPAPEGLRAAVRSRLTAPSGRPSPPRPFPLSWPLPLPRALSWKTALAAAAVVLVGAFSVNLLRGTRPGAGPLASPPAASPATPFPGTAPAAPSAPQRSAEGVGAVDLAAPTAPGARQVIRTAHVQLAVDDLEAASRRLITVAESAGGFVASSSSSQTGPAPEGVFTLRVPAARFAAVLLEVERLGTVEARRIGGQDVTEEFVDLQARIRNLERHESRLLSFMDRATRVSDLLAIEQELARVRGQIEALTGRLRYLGNQVELAAIEVAMRQKAPSPGGGLWDPGAALGRMRAAFLATVRQILAAVERLAVTAAALAPLAALAVVVWIAVRRYRLRAA